MRTNLHCPLCDVVLARWSVSGELELDVPGMATQSRAGAWVLCPCGGQQVVRGARVLIHEDER